MTIRYGSCSEGVVYLVIHGINQIMNAWKLTKNVLYFIQYVTLKYNHIEYQSFTYCCIIFFLFNSYLHSNKITSIKIRLVQQHYKGLSVVNIPLIFFLHSMSYNTFISILYIVYELFRQNIQIPRQNKRNCIILITHTCTSTV